MTHSEKFKKAFELILGIHQQNGDKDWVNFREEAFHAVTKYEEYKEWYNDLNSRSDLSDDFAWELECFEDSFKVLFALMRGISN